MSVQQESILTREQFKELPVPEKLDYLYDTLIPIAESYNYVLIVKQFGIGLAGIVVSISSVGIAMIWVWNFVKSHIR